MTVRLNIICVGLLATYIWIPVSTSAQSELPPLGTSTETGWQKYVAATEERLGRDATRDLAVVKPGETLVTRVEPSATGGRSIDVPDAWVHHWRGTVLLPGVTLDQLLARLERNVPTAPDVVSSTILRREGPQLTVFLRVQRQQTLIGFVTLTYVYDTVHSVTLARTSATRGSSSIRATRISEIESAGSRSERALPAGQDSGFLWRWHSYWRYQQIAGGVVAQCESVSLSRTAPFGTRFIAERVASSAANESMTQALVSLRDWMTSGRTPPESLPVQSAAR